ncbi:hypothetical protein SH2C18_43720 [Clostridium sediminicola]|uniref:hypothetical protein n=1 Tax=Clostridium sediminicola TaxID=3114879 RepID=UPI0031F24647
MFLNTNNCFIVKNSHFTSNLYYYNKNTIYCKTLSQYPRKEFPIAENCKDNFSIVLTPNDEIKLFFLNNSGDVCFVDDWRNPLENVQIAKKEFSNLKTSNLKSFYYKDDIFLLYNVLNKKNNSNSLLFQEFDSDIAFFNPKYSTIADKIIGNSIEIFTNNNLLVVFYQIYDSLYKLGYKYYKKDMQWSSFKLLAESNLPFTNYSVISNAKNIFFTYLKNENSVKKVFITYLAKKKFANKLIYKKDGINNLETFILNEFIYFTWSENNNVYYKKYKYNNLNTKNQPNEIIQLDFQDELSLCTYLTNVVNEKKYLVSNKLYYYLDNPLELPLISEVLPLVTSYNSSYSLSNENNTYSTVEKDLINILSTTAKPNTRSENKGNIPNRKEEIKIEAEKYKKRIMNLEMAIDEKDKIISTKTEVISNKNTEIDAKDAELLSLKSKIESYEKKFLYIRNQYTKFDELKEQLNSKLISLQDNIIRKDKKILELQNIVNEKNKQILNTNHINSIENTDFNTSNISEEPNKITKD